MKVTLVTGIICFGLLFRLSPLQEIVYKSEQ